MRHRLIFGSALLLALAGCDNRIRHQKDSVLRCRVVLQQDMGKAQWGDRGRTPYVDAVWSGRLLIDSCSFLCSGI